jgi:TonB family protein
VEKVDAEYPPEAIATRLDGTVVLLVTVGIEGKATGVSVDESAGADFDRAAIAAVQRWRFIPARSGDRLLASRVRIPFHFVLPKVEAVLLPPPTLPPPDAKAPANPPDAEAPMEVTVRGRRIPPSRGASDYQLDVGALATVPRLNASDVLKLAPGILLTNEGGEAHAEQVFLRGFDAREGQDIEFTVDGVPINESGNLHGNGYSDTHFIIPELIQSLRVLEGPFDPRQGNYAVAGSADYHLGLLQRGVTAKSTAGSYGTYRQLITYGPPGESPGTFLGPTSTRPPGLGRTATRGMPP